MEGMMFEELYLITNDYGLRLSKVRVIHWIIQGVFQSAHYTENAVMVGEIVLDLKRGVHGQWEKNFQNSRERKRSVRPYLLFSH